VALVETENIDAMAYHQLVALSLPQQITRNRTAIAQLSNRLATASRLLGAAATIFLVGVFFIVGRHIHS
jgi:hypothetical protein